MTRMHSACLASLLLSTSALLPVLSEEVQAPQKHALFSQDELAQLEQEASRIRGLEFQKSVDYVVVDKSSLPELIDARINEEFPPGKLEKLSVAYVKLGLIEKGFNLKDAILALYSEQIAAFYDQKKRKLYSIRDLPFSGEFQKILMVHELTHALQDQNFDLSTLPLECKDNDDRALAALSLVEGDATLLFTQYTREEAKLGLKDILAATSTGQSELIQAPYVIRKNLMFPYMEGVKFVTRLFRKGGWQSINRAFKDPPQSTEQIMHPEKYLDKRDDPVRVVLPDLSSLAGKKWGLLEDNVLGELNTKVLFTEFLGSIRAVKPSRGWGGDRFRVYQAEGEERTILIWGTVWDTQNDREEFVLRYLDAMRQKYKGLNFETVEQEDSACLISEDVVIWLGWEEKKVLVIEAPDMATLLAVVWEFFKAGGGLRMTEEVQLPEEVED